ncbi:MAG: TIM-barrel domain-containing protein, partial [Fusobacteriaceae bacterium]
GKMNLDMGFKDKNLISIEIPKQDVGVYIIQAENNLEIIKEFMTLVGKSYLPPKWAFGFQQSRWSYENSEKIDWVIEEFRKNDIPCDCIYLDIDYMVEFMDFTLNKDLFPDFEKWIVEKKKQGIRIIPIIDAGVKVKDGYETYEVGKANNYFCKNKEGEDFQAAVWPGLCTFPDFLNPEVRKWWGKEYKKLIDLGIEGFWNDMNEPAIFYSPERLEKAIDGALEAKGKNLGVYDFFNLKDSFLNLSNNESDYKAFYHTDKDGKKMNHYDVHNIYGTNMTRAASEGFQEINKEKRFLLFSRASHIGAHRYGGIWTGDNHSWWSHLLLNIQMLPSLNMCGFLYSGADTGGFGANASGELINRWNQFSIFAPLYRNHSALGTRTQEPFAFSTEEMEHNRNFIKFRYALIPYIYSEFLKSRENNKPYLMPLSFVYNDEREKDVQDQILAGDSLMLTPVYMPNQKGRTVYLPEDMLFCQVKKWDEIKFQTLSKGDHYIQAGIDTIPLFIRKDKILPLAKPEKCVDDMKGDTLQLICYLDKKATYELYDDDGVTNNAELLKANIEITLKNGEPQVVVEKSEKLKYRKFNLMIILSNGKVFNKNI